MKYLLFACLLLISPLYSQSAQDELVNVKEFIHDIVLDLKYNTEDNFLSQKCYTTDECYLSRALLERVILIQDSLRNITIHDGISYPQGLALKIWDGYRPRAVQYLMWELVGPPWVANPASGSRHNRGEAADVTLVDRASGEELEMPTYFDEFTPAAAHGYMNLPANVIANRELLKNMMVQVGGLNLYDAEWWHYTLPIGYPLLDFQMK
ncbi:MAG: M15 family metallopeptidase [bacterium]|nr:MAG: M15 family metallopeptidase [bacterium]